MDVPLGQGRPIWVDDDRFDISYHVRLTALPNPGSRDQLLTLCSRIQAGCSTGPARCGSCGSSRGSPAATSALIQKTHHALVDGVSGVDVATVLLDFTPEPTPVDTPAWVPAPPPGVGVPALRLAAANARRNRPRWCARARAAVRGPAARRGERDPDRAVDAVDGRPADGRAAHVAQHPRWGATVASTRCKVSLDDVKAVRRALGGTVNDVVLAGVAGGLRRLLESRDEAVDGLTLKVLCPVSVRDEHEHLALGNRVSAMFVSLPVGEPDPVARLDGDPRRPPSDLKEREQAVGAAFLVDLTEYAAPTLLGLAARAAHRQPFFNLIVTNVPGPAGAALLHGRPHARGVPGGARSSKNTSVVVGILSYCGQLHFGLFADRDAVADLAVLAARDRRLVRGAREVGRRATTTEATGWRVVVTELWERDAWELADDVRSGTLSAVELLDVHLARIEELDPKLNAIAYLDADGARARAIEIDREVAAGDDPGPFAGVPLGVKELAQVEGMPDTHASQLYRDKIAAHDCTEVARLRAAGAVIVGLTTAPEFGIPSFTNSPLHGVTRNPWNPERTPGGSSGGSAAAVSAGMLPFCTGSDGGGSIRIPSSYTGLPGFKTTFGTHRRRPRRRVRRRSHVGERTDGPFGARRGALHRRDRRARRSAIRRRCRSPSRTSRSSRRAIPRRGCAASGSRGRRRSATASSIPRSRRSCATPPTCSSTRPGCELVDIDVTLPKPGRSWGLLERAEHGRVAPRERARATRTSSTSSLRTSIEGMPHLRARHLGSAVRRRHELLLATADVFSQVDLLLTPTTATTAFAAEGVLSGEVDGREVDLMILSAAFTAPFNMTGQPGFSIPAGLVGGMPVGLQAVARRLEDDLTVACAAVLEQARPWPKLAPA